MNKFILYIIYLFIISCLYWTSIFFDFTIASFFFDYLEFLTSPDVTLSLRGYLEFYFIIIAWYSLVYFFMAGIVVFGNKFFHIDKEE